MPNGLHRIDHQVHEDLGKLPRIRTQRWQYRWGAQANVDLALRRLRLQQCAHMLQDPQQVSRLEIQFRLTGQPDKLPDDPVQAVNLPADDLQALVGRGLKWNRQMVEVFPEQLDMDAQRTQRIPQLMGEACKQAGQ